MKSRKTETIYVKYLPKELGVFQKSYNPTKVTIPNSLKSIKSKVLIKIKKKRPESGHKCN